MITAQNIKDLLNKYNNLPEECKLTVNGYTYSPSINKDYTIYLCHGKWQDGSLTESSIRIKREKPYNSEEVSYIIISYDKQLLITEEEFTELSLLCNKIIEAQRQDILSKFGVDV